MCISAALLYWQKSNRPARTTGWSGTLRLPNNLNFQGACLRSFQFHVLSKAVIKHVSFKISSPIVTSVDRSCPILYTKNQIKIRWCWLFIKWSSRSLSHSTFSEYLHRIFEFAHLKKWLLHKVHIDVYKSKMEGC